MESREAIRVCRICGTEYRGAQPGDRCTHHPETVLLAPDLIAGHSQDPVLGRVIGGKYAAFDVLGVGGFGAVYRAIQEPVGRQVALKVIHNENAGDPELRARFFREAKLVARLRDRTVVTLYDYGEAPDIGLYMVFELVEGHTLGALMVEGPQPADRVVNILIQLLRALAEAHAMGMVHRDLKPGNVMLVHDVVAYGQEAVRLLDFGIAKVRVKEDQERSLETQRGLVMGTPRYLSPEQARATGEVDHRSDLYSLAVMGYTLLAGSNPFERGSVIETIMAHCTSPVPALDPTLEVPGALEAVLHKALSKQPEDRFASAQEMSNALEQSMPQLPSGIFRSPQRTGDLLVDPSSKALSYASYPSHSSSQSVHHMEDSGPAAGNPASGTFAGRIESPKPSKIWVLAALFIFVGAVGFGGYRMFSAAQINTEPVQSLKVAPDRPAHPKLVPPPPEVDPVEESLVTAKLPVVDPPVEEKEDETLVVDETPPAPKPKTSRPRRRRRRAKPERAQVEAAQEVEPEKPAPPAAPKPRTRLEVPEF